MAWFFILVGMSFLATPQHCISDDTPLCAGIDTQKNIGRKKMKHVNRNRTLLKLAAAALLLAAWVSAPFLGINVKADGTPVVEVKTATLTSPSGTANPHGTATWELYQSGNRELEVEVEDL